MSSYARPGPVVVCDVCETAQEPASVCAECGMPLRVPQGVPLTGDPVIQRLPGFEPTVDERVGDVGATRLAALESTHFDEAAEVEAGVLPGFEPTADLALDGGGDAVPIPGLERTTEDFVRDTGPDAFAIPLACPYCGYQQREGRICNNCGRAKTRLLPPQAAPVARRRAADTTVRCMSCGIYVQHGALCSDCGQPLPPLATA